MSLAYVRNHILGPIMEILDENKKTRAAVQTTLGQLFIFPESHLAKIHADYGISTQDHTIIYTWFLGELRNETVKLRNKSTERYQELVDIISFKNMKDTFIVCDHKSLSDIKNKWAQKVADVTGVAKGEIDGSNNKTGWQLGHGDAGYAVSAMTAIRGLGVLTRADKFTKGSEKGQIEVESLRNDVIDQYLNIISSAPISIDRNIQVEVETDMWVDSKGNLKKDNTYILTFQSAKENQDAAPGERAALTKIKKYIEQRYVGAHNILKEHGGDTAEDAIEGIIDYTIGSSVKNARVSGPKGKSSYRTRHKVSDIAKQKISVRTTTLKPTGRKPTTEKSRVNLVALLNAKLGEEIRKRMTYPRLMNRTGRFSESVRVLSTDQTQKGGTSVSYTYQKNPYQLFESGRSHLATPAREPRAIIDESIRSIAQKAMIGRFYTRRI